MCRGGNHHCGWAGCRTHTEGQGSAERPCSESVYCPLEIWQQTRDTRTWNDATGTQVILERMGPVLFQRRGPVSQATSGFRCGLPTSVTWKRTWWCAHRVAWSRWSFWSRAHPWSGESTFLLAQYVWVCNKKWGHASHVWSGRLYHLGHRLSISSRISLWSWCPWICWVWSRARVGLEISWWLPMTSRGTCKLFLLGIRRQKLQHRSCMILFFATDFRSGYIPIRVEILKARWLRSFVDLLA